MRVKKVFNNNILLAEDENLLEVILMGRGIGSVSYTHLDVYKRQK